MRVDTVVGNPIPKGDIGVIGLWKLIQSLLHGCEKNAEGHHVMDVVCKIDC